MGDHMDIKIDRNKIYHEFCNKNRWDEIITRFSDLNIYQTAAYEENRKLISHADRILVKRGQKIIACSQIRISKVPGFKIGIAYILWGPMWRINSEKRNIDNFRSAIDLMKKEYAFKKGLVVRVYPFAYKFEDNSLCRVLIEEGFSPYEDNRNYRTLIIDLNPPLENIRMLLKQKWRNCLNRSQRNHLSIFEGTHVTLFDELENIYREMVVRKGIKYSNDFKYLKRVQNSLPPHKKLRVLLCKRENQICAGAIFAALGDTAIYLVGATSNEGMKYKGSYLVQWCFIKWLKKHGFKYYDLNGINPDGNPGTYHFKNGLAGKKGIDTVLLGKFQFAPNRNSLIILKYGELLFTKAKYFRQSLNF